MICENCGKSTKKSPYKLCDSCFNLSLKLNTLKDVIKQDVETAKNLYNEKSNILEGMEMGFFKKDEIKANVLKCSRCGWTYYVDKSTSLQDVNRMQKEHLCPDMMPVPEPPAPAPAPAPVTMATPVVPVVSVPVATPVLSRVHKVESGFVEQDYTNLSIRDLLLEILEKLKKLE